MTPQIILSGIFVLVSVIATVLCFTVFKKQFFSRFVGASGVVFFSACLMILMFAIFKKDLPMLFFILSDGLVAGIFAMTTALMVILCSKTFMEVAKSAKVKEKDDKKDKDDWDDDWNNKKEEKEESVQEE
ncbi:MAG: hypothetical protein J6Y08_02595 [Clostridiales bacterium]|nr:hypothetical protein [Clostridiales bacterium]